MYNEKWQSPPERRTYMNYSPPTFQSRTVPSNRTGNRWLQSIKRDRWLYIMFAPVLIYYVIFHYAPIGGLVVAFKDYNLFQGIWASPWVGLEHFSDFFSSIYFGRLLRNTLAISLLDLLIGFPAPIVLALMLNEVQSALFKRTVQTVSYLPHFVSMVVIAGLVVNFLSPSTGLINSLIAMFGGEKVSFLAEPQYFWIIFTLMNCWKGIGWGSIIYLATLSGVDPSLYEAAIVDGAGRWKQTWYITLPSIMPTIIILLIMRIGGLLSVSYEAIILMYNPSIYQTADILSTYVYRRGLIDADYSFATAVGLFQSVFALILVVSANKISKKISETSLW